MNDKPDTQDVVVRDVMKSEPRCVYPETPIIDAAKLMTDSRVGMLPVCDGRRVVGVVTDRDIVQRHVAASLPTLTVGSILTPLPYVISPDASLEEAIELMQEHRVRRLPVCDNHELVGVISETDIKHHVTEQVAD
ncbi:MAG: CBS domain-containing protein [Gaiellaceae bacterium]